MIGKFFLTLIQFWLPDPKHEQVCRQAIDFYYWSGELKKRAFLSGLNRVAEEWRITQLRKCISKMPFLSPEFHSALDQLEEQRPKNFPQESFEFLTIKRNNVPSLISFLKNLSEKDVDKLREMLLQSEAPNQFFRLKRNKKKKG